MQVSLIVLHYHTTYNIDVKLEYILHFQNMEHLQASNVWYIYFFTYLHFLHIPQQSIDSQFFCFRQRKFGIAHIFSCSWNLTFQFWARTNLAMLSDVCADFLNINVNNERILFNHVRVLEYTLCIKRGWNENKIVNILHMYQSNALHRYLQSHIDILSKIYWIQFSHFFSFELPKICNNKIPTDWINYPWQ